MAGRTAAKDRVTAGGNPIERKRSGTVDMFFRGAEQIAHLDDPIWKDVSCVAAAGKSIFCSADEGASVERLLLDAESGRAEGHASFALADAFDLPGGRAGEMDIEGMAVSDGYLWICGSHSLKRDDPEEDGLADMLDIDWDENRAFLGRVPLLDQGGGVFEPMIAVEAMGDAPARTSRMLKMHGSADKAPLRKMLAADPLLGPFVGLPCKENGLDIEGLAVQGQTVLLGLRGPVIGGLAFIVRLELKETGEGRLKPRKQANGKRYALQALDLGGQGIRDLIWRGDRLLVLGGATTNIETQQIVVAIDGYDPAREIYGAGALARVLDLPFLRGADHAEGIDLVEIGGADALLVTYDSPHGERADAAKNRLTADLFEIPLPPENPI